MSKISDFLEKIHSAAPTPLGFGADRSEKAPGLGLFASLNKPTKQKLSTLSNNVDAIIFSEKPDNNLVKDIAIPWMCSGTDSEDSVSSLVEIGCDSIHCDLSAEVSAIANDNISVFLSVPVESDWNQLMILNTLPVDGYIINPKDLSSISLKKLSEIGSITRSTDKYCLLSINQSPTASELEALRKVGVMGLIINGDEVSTPDIKKLKTNLTDMPNPNHKRKQRPQVKSVFEIEE